MNTKKKVFPGLAVALVLIVLLGTITVGYTTKIGWLPVRVLEDAREGQIRVACVGDSITFGAGVFDWRENAYPVVLGRLLGDGYVVNNYGYSGRTALFDGDMPYVKDGVYRKSLDFQPDIVVIMLGTNDTKPVNWQGAERYKEDYAKIIDSYLTLPSSPEIYIIAPPPVFAMEGIITYTIDGALVASDIRNTIFELAQEKNLYCIDMYAVFADRGEYFPDGVHPDKDGAKIFARAVCDAILAPE